MASQTDPYQVKLGVVINPRSGRGRGSRSRKEAIDALQRHFPAMQVVQTTAPGSATHQARSLASDGCTVVVAGGGDGTIRDVMQGVLGTTASLAVLPLGTGNDFARSIGIGVNLRIAVEAIVGGRRRRIDVARCTRGDYSAHFANVAGCGFDAVVADKVNKGYRHLNGKWAYVAAIINALASYKATSVRLEVDGEQLEVKAMLCAFANARSYGGGMLFAPMADLSDGLLDLVILEELGRLQFLTAFPKVFKGKHLSHPRVSHRRFKSLTISSEPPVPYLLDGEMLAPGPLRIEVVPSALDVLVPEAER